MSLTRPLHFPRSLTVLCHRLSPFSDGEAHEHSLDGLGDHAQHLLHSEGMNLTGLVQLSIPFISSTNLLAQAEVNKILVSTRRPLDLQQATIIQTTACLIKTIDISEGIGPSIQT